jgi:hypothetical protein
MCPSLGLVFEDTAGGLAFEGAGNLASDGGGDLASEDAGNLVSGGAGNGAVCTSGSALPSTVMPAALVEGGSASRTDED